MTLRDFTADLAHWWLLDCEACGNSGVIETQAASVTIVVPCPECARSDWHADAAAAGWAEQ